MGHPQGSHLWRGRYGENASENLQTLLECPFCHLTLHAPSLCAAWYLFDIWCCWLLSPWKMSPGFLLFFWLLLVLFQAPFFLHLSQMMVFSQSLCSFSSCYCFSDFSHIAFLQANFFFKVVHPFPLKLSPAFCTTKLASSSLYYALTRVQKIRGCLVCVVLL